MADVADRSTVPPPLPPKTRKNVNNTVINTNNQVITPPSTKPTVFGGVISEDGTVTPPCEEQHEMFSFSFPEVRSLNLQTSSSAPHSITNGDHHVVKIRINPGDDAISTSQYPASLQQFSSLCATKTQVSSFGKQETQSLNLHQSHYTATQSEGCIRINVGSSEIEQSEEMVRRTAANTSRSSSSSSIPSNFIKSSPTERPNPYFFYGSFASNGMVISSGQSSPSDTLDSGTCSDLDGSTPPPLPKKKSVTSSAATVTVTVNGGGHRRTGSLTSSGAEVDSDDDGSNISCDSLNSSELNGGLITSIVEDVHAEKVNFKEENKLKRTETRDVAKVTAPTPPAFPVQKSNSSSPPPGHSLPQGLLQDIRDRTAKLTIVASPSSTLTRKTRTWADDLNSKATSVKPTTVQPEQKTTNEAKINGTTPKVHHDLSPTPSLSSFEDPFKRSIVEEKTYEERQKETAEKQATSNKIVNNGLTFDTDKFYKFHLNEHATEVKDNVQQSQVENEETFAGYKDLLQDKELSSTIRSAKGTVRGVKNRVRAGIATFLQLHSTKVRHENFHILFGG
ncbi:hypothetical protein C0J52_20580 [Blattella germanica]|nr:hypothetical protein C0J52_20580 [Blattella germanica]